MNHEEKQCPPNINAGMWILRSGVYFAGLLSVSLGIVLCVKCGYGISPISSVPYALEFVVPLSFGTLSWLQGNVGKFLLQKTDGFEAAASATQK